jgi:ABC-type transporter MlaC component
MKCNHKSKDPDARLEKIIDLVFDFREMAKRSLGIHLRDATPEGRQEFVPLFTGETVGINYAELDTQVAGREGI